MFELCPKDPVLLSALAIFQGSLWSSTKKINANFLKILNLKKIPVKLDQTICFEPIEWLEILQRVALIVGQKGIKTTSDHLLSECKQK